MNEGGTNYTADAAVGCSGEASLLLWPGQWLVTVFPVNLHSNYTAQQATKRITVGTSNAPVAFVLRRDERSVRVQASLVDESGFELDQGMLYFWHDLELPPYLLGMPLQTGADLLDKKVVPGSYRVAASFGDGADLVGPGLGVHVVRQIPETNFVLVALGATNTVQGHVQLPAGMSPWSGSVYASMNRSGTNYSVYATPADDGSYQIKLPSGEWSIGPSYYCDCNCTVTNITLPDGPSVVDLICVSNAPVARTIHGRVVDEAGVPVPLVQVWSTSPAPSASMPVWTDFDGSFVLSVSGDYAYLWPYVDLQRGFIAGTTHVDLESASASTNVTLIVRRPTAEVSAEVLDEFGANILCGFGVNVQIGSTSYSAPVIGDAMRVLPVFAGEWQIQPYDWDLNAQGLRSLPSQKVTGTSNEHLVFLTHSIVGDGRVPTLSVPVIGPTNIQFHVRSQTLQAYGIERSTDLQSWERVGINSSYGGSFSFSDTNAPGGFRFYRAVMLPWPYYW